MSHAPPAAMTVEQPWRRTHLAVPRSDATLLAIPDLDGSAEAAEANREALDDLAIDVQGRPFDRLRHWARTEAIAAARDFTGATGPLGDAAADADPAAAIVVTGHQPALYHPGVWAKNFAAAGIAGRLDGGVLNLVVDNDIYSRAAIDVPAGTRDRPRRIGLSFDERQRARPWEGAVVQDRDLFESFGGRVAATMRTWNVAPLIETHWWNAELRSSLGADIPECLTTVRHAIEASWGLHNLELRMSDLCETDPFLWVAGHLLAQLPRFVDVHNGVLHEYRQLYRLKSRNHPVPALEHRDEWVEAPFWVWRDEAPHRRRVFAKSAGREVTLADDAGHTFAVLPLSPSMDACCAVEVLRTLPDQGIRFRTRALTTTLFARLFLADLFAHGIGGAKYDEMTDRIIARFFGIPAPEYATVSASMYLPFAPPFGETSDDERRLLAQLRDLEQNPQRHLSRGVDPHVDRLLDEKAALIAEQDASTEWHGLPKRLRRERSGENARRFRRIQEVTAELATYAAEQRELLRAELAQTRQRLAANRVLTSREFSFALYPETALRPFLTDLAGS